MSKQFKIKQSFTNLDSVSFTKYLQEISQIKVLTPEEEEKLALLAKNGNEEATALLIECNLRFVVSVAKQYVTKDCKIGDLINEGNIGLIEGAQRFEPSKGFKFITYAVHWIKRRMTEYVNNHSRLVRLPANRISDISKMKTYRERFEQENGREPDMSELLDMDIEENPNDIKEALYLSNIGASSSLDYTDEDGMSLSDTIPDTIFGQPDSEMIRIDSENNVAAMLSSLDETEQTVIKYTLGIGVPAISYGEVGDIVGLSSDSTKDMKERALKKLAKHFKKNPNLLAEHLG
jgi:RNA polymerase primary sigma factor